MDVSRIFRRPNENNLAIEDPQELIQKQAETIRAQEAQYLEMRAAAEDLYATLYIQNGLIQIWISLLTRQIEATPETEQIISTIQAAATLIEVQATTLQTAIYFLNSQSDHPPIDEIVQ